MIPTAPPPVAPVAPVNLLSPQQTALLQQVPQHVLTQLQQGVVTSLQASGQQLTQQLILQATVQAAQIWLNNQRNAQPRLVSAAGGCDLAALHGSMHAMPTNHHGVLLPTAVLECVDLWVPFSAPPSHVCAGTCPCPGAPGGKTCYGTTIHGSIWPWWCRQGRDACPTGAGHPSAWHTSWASSSSTGSTGAGAGSSPEPSAASPAAEETQGGPQVCSS